MKVSAPHRGWTSGRATPSLRPNPYAAETANPAGRHLSFAEMFQTTGAGSILLRLRDMTGRAPSMARRRSVCGVVRGTCGWPPWAAGAQNERAMLLNSVERGDSIFVGEHDGHDAGRDGGIGRIRRTELGFSIVVVDLEKAADAGFIDRAEVVFLMRIVILD